MLPILRNKNTALAPVNGTGRPVNRLTSLFDNLFDDNFLAPVAAPTWATFPLTMWEDEEAVYAEVDVPGMTDRDIDLSVHDGALIVRGERKCEQKGALYEGRTYGRFEQRVTLPAAVDADRVEAKIANGVLRVKLAKSPESKPRKIAIRKE